MTVSAESQAPINLQEPQPFRWTCTGERPIVRLPLRRVHDSGYVSCALIVAEPPRVVSPLIRFMRGEQQAAAVHYNRRANGLFLDNSEGDELIVALKGNDRPVITFEVNPGEVAIDVGEERRSEPLDQWRRLLKAEPTPFDEIRLGANHGLPAGWGPPIGFEFVVFWEGLVEDMERAQPSVLKELIEIRQRMDIVIGQLRG